MLLSLLEYIEVSSLLSVDDINVGFITIFISFSPDFLWCSRILYVWPNFFKVFLINSLNDDFLSLTIWHSTYLPWIHDQSFLRYSLLVCHYLFSIPGVISVGLISLSDFFIDSRIWLISQPYQWCQLFSDIGQFLAIYIFPSSSRSIGRGCGLSLSLRLWVDGDLIAILGLILHVVLVQLLALILEWALVRILEALWIIDFLVVI